MNKQKKIKDFNRAANVYDQNAIMQHQIAEDLELVLHQKN
jgi:hypothetical protein